jgi:hypothetical protein
MSAVAAALGPAVPVNITLFGSAPLQLTLDEQFLSADVDVFCQKDLRPIIEAAGLGPGRRDIYVQQSDEIVFSAGPSWRERAFSITFGSITVVLPHWIDILVSKLPRLEPKDLEAYHMVVRRTGHPSPDELMLALQRHVDLFRPGFDEEHAGDPITNARTLWRELYGLEIDVRAEIIAPALERRRQGYNNAINHKAVLEALGDGAS